MIFKQVLVDQILAGNKTMTRRPVNFENPKSHYWHEKCRYRPGSKMTVQANYNGPAPASGVVTGLRRERWKDIGEGDAEREGFTQRITDTDYRTARMEFIDYVRMLYPDLDLNDECWVIEFAIESAQTRQTAISGPSKEPS